MRELNSNEIAVVHGGECYGATSRVGPNSLTIGGTYSGGEFIVCVSAVFDEIGRFMEALPEMIGQIFDQIADFFESVMEMISSFVAGVWGNLTDSPTASQSQQTIELL